MNSGWQQTVLNWLKHPEKVFLLVGFAFGLLFLVVTPPFQEPDAYVHFLRAYTISEGETAAFSAYVPQSLIDFIEDVNPDPLPGNVPNKQSKRALFNQFSVPFDDFSQVGVDLTLTIEYSHVAYTPQVIGISTARMLHLPAICMFYFARVCNFIVWLSMMFLAIKKTPIHKWVFFLLGLLPMTLFLGASVSPDALLIGAAFLFVAVCLDLALTPERKVRMIDFWILSLLLVVIGFMKPGYSLLWILILIIPAKRFALPWRKVDAVVLLFIIAFLPILLWQIMTPVDGQYTRSNEGVMPQMDYILTNPGLFMSDLLRNFAGQWLNVGRQFIGVLGWLDTPLPDFLYLFFAAAFLVIPLLDSNADINLTWSARLLGIGLYFAGFLGLLSVFYLTKSETGASVFHPIQGRYLLPLSPVFFLFLYQTRIKINRNWLGLTAAIALFGLVVALRVLLLRYYAI